MKRQIFMNGIASSLPLMNLQLSASNQTATHFPAKAKKVIVLFMAGGPSQIELFDDKPTLRKLHGKPLPKSVSKGQRVTAMTKGKKQLICGSKYKFKKFGGSGLELSELLPCLGSVIDDLCLIKSTYTHSINHDPAKTFFCTGTEMAGHASLGAWLSYALGTMNPNLPDYVVMNSSRYSGIGNIQGLYSRLWGSGFLPGKHQGVCLQPAGDPVLYLKNPAGINHEMRKAMLHLVKRINQRDHQQSSDPEILTSIEQQEMAYRMQSSVPELTDITDERQTTLDMYGARVHTPGSYARNCLLARRMVERDVRFVKIFHRGWDHHSNVTGYCKTSALDMDQATAALIKDLKQRGLLEETLVVFAGEFGRTAYGQGNIDKFGRDHHPRCFTTWLTGAGVKSGLVYGKTDDFSYNIEENPVHVRDLLATILNILGLNHEALVYPFNGLDQRLTGVEPARVIRDILS